MKANQIPEAETLKPPNCPHCEASLPEVNFFNWIKSPYRSRNPLPALHEDSVHAGAHVSGNAIARRATTEKAESDLLGENQMEVKTISTEQGIEIDRLYRIDVVIEKLHKILNELKDLRNEDRIDPFGTRGSPERRTPQSPMHPYPSERRTVITYPGSAPQFMERRRSAGKGKLYRNRT